MIKIISIAILSIVFATGLHAKDPEEQNASCLIQAWDWVVWNGLPALF